MGAALASARTHDANSEFFQKPFLCVVGDIAFLGSQTDSFIKGFGYLIQLVALVSSAAIPLGVFLLKRYGSVFVS